MEGWKTSCHREFCKRNEQATKMLLDSLQLLTFETRISVYIYNTSSTQLIKMACISFNIFKVLLSMQKEKNKRKMLIRFLQHGIFTGYWLNSLHCLFATEGFRKSHKKWISDLKLAKLGSNMEHNECCF